MNYADGTKDGEAQKLKVMLVIVRTGGYLDMLGIVIIGWAAGGHAGHGTPEKAVRAHSALQLPAGGRQARPNG